jgi:hypothetical protein
MLFLRLKRTHFGHTKDEILLMDQYRHEQNMISSLSRYSCIVRRPKVKLSPGLVSGHLPPHSLLVCNQKAKLQVASRLLCYLTGNRQRSFSSSLSLGLQSLFDIMLEEYK